MDGKELHYRPDIDGLRAVAVLSVIGFHASEHLVPGGYVGVDIFFVISGFLITSIIARQLQHGTFTFRDFYARRCKRMFPALIVTLVAVFAFGWVFLLPDEYETLGKHIAGGAGFVSNFVLWSESGYFDKAAASKPLLHLWSLGIEEQFYLLWPPFLVLAWKRKWNLLKVTVGIVSVSFVLNVVFVSLWQAPDMYYLPPIRAWELLLGAALAFAPISRIDELLARIKNVIATFGVSLILIGMFVLDSATAFPGWWALLPTVGSVSLIYAGPNAWVNRYVLANRVLVFIGLISYPLYLWHWPLLSYAQIVFSGTPPASLRWAMVGTALSLASLTYLMLEKSIRIRTHKTALVLAGCLAVVACSGVAALAGRIHARSENYAVANISKAATREWEFPGPRLKSVRTELGYHFERGDHAHKVLFVGDSHMEQYYPRVDRILTEHPDGSKGVLFVTHRLCLPIHPIESYIPKSCIGLVENAFALAQDARVDTVVIGAAWNRYEVFQSKDRESALDDLAATVGSYRKIGKRVYLLLPIPRGELFDPAVLVRRSFRDFGFTVKQQLTRAEADATIAPIASQLSKIAASAGALVLDPIDYICQAQTCSTLDPNGLPVYTDDSHLRSAFVREHVTFLDSIVINPTTVASPTVSLSY